MTNYTIEEVKENPYLLEEITNQTEEICLEAVKQDGYALQYVRNQTEEICLEAIKQISYALRFVKNQTHDLCLEAIKQNKNSIIFVNEAKKTITEEEFGTYGGELAVYMYNNQSVIKTGCWVGDLEAFKIKVWERFELGFEYQTKEDVEAIIKKIEALA